MQFNIEGVLIKVSKADDVSDRWGFTVSSAIQGVDSIYGDNYLTKFEALNAAKVYVYRCCLQSAAIYRGRADRLDSLKECMQQLGVSEDNLRSARWGVKKEEKVG